MKMGDKGIKIVILVVIMIAVALPASAKKGHRNSQKDIMKEAVKEALAEGVPGTAFGSWEYMAINMRPPKNEKWTARWNEIGTQGWELVGKDENTYIFKRPAAYGVASSAATPAEVQPEAASEAVSSSVAPVTDTVEDASGAAAAGSRRLRTKGRGW